MAQRLRRSGRQRRTAQVSRPQPAKSASSAARSVGSTQGAPGGRFRAPKGMSYRASQATTLIYGKGGYGHRERARMRGTAHDLRILDLEEDDVLSVDKEEIVGVAQWAGQSSGSRTLLGPQMHAGCSDASIRHPASLSCAEGTRQR